MLSVCFNYTNMELKIYMYSNEYVKTLITFFNKELTL